MEFQLARIAALLSLACLAACQSTPQAVTDYDPDADFSEFRTFTWIAEHPVVRGQGQGLLNPVTQRRLMSESRATLERRGLRFVDDPLQADLAVAFTIGSRNGIRVTSFPSSSFHMSTTHGRQIHAWHGYWGNSTVQTTRYTEGQIAVDLFDIEAARPVWHGTVRFKETDRSDPSEMIRTAVRAIFARFPPA